jgi:hypothetical protein
MSAFRHRIILFMAAAILFQQAALSQVLRLPLIFRHYSEHRAKDHALTFSHFLNVHYLGDDQDDSDNERDRELPFKSFSAAPVAEVNLSCTYSFAPPPVPSGNLIFHYLSEATSGIPSGIWQPPRI